MAMRHGFKIIGTLVASMLSLASPSFGRSPAATLERYPTSSATSIAFVAHGDLWIAPREGGTARRLVHSAGYILTPRFSPDGRWIAYTERLSGGQDVHAVSVVDGSTVRITHDVQPSAGGNLVVGWSPDGTRILFLSTRRSVASRQVQAFSAPLSGGLAERLPLDQSGRLDVSPDGQIAFTRTFTDLASRKRYVGGEAEDIFVTTMGSDQVRRVTDWKGTDTAPMWCDGSLYYLSDRGAGFRLNLWHYDFNSRQSRQVTHFTDGDIDWPSIGGGRIVFQQHGFLWAFDVRNERLKRLHVDVPEDPTRTASRVAVVDREVRVSDVTGARDFAVAPDGSAAIVAAHGDLFKVALIPPIASLPAIDMTDTPGVQEEHPTVSPDGKTLAYVTEHGDSQQIAVRSIDGGSERILTKFAGTVLYAPVYSPSGRRLAVGDANHRLWMLSDVVGSPELVTHDPVAEIRDATFSPDDQWLAYSTTRRNGLSALHLRDLASGRDTIVSGETDGDRLPAFSSDGRYLYFISQRREFALTGDRGDEASIVSVASDGLYVSSLTNGVAGLASRATAVPTSPGRIASLQVRKDRLFYELRPISGVSGELSGTTAALHRVDAGGDTVVLSDFDQQLVSTDGEHVVFHRANGWGQLEFGQSERKLAFSNLQMTVDPRAEWRAMIERAWRLDRDLFFNRTMNGSSWNAVHAAYAPLLSRIGSRDDFQYVLGQLQGEMATSHAFVAGIDAGDPSPAVPANRLGADLELDRTSGHYRFVHVFTGDPSRERFRAPLNDPAANISVLPGEYLLSIDGKQLHAPIDPDELLLGNKESLKLTIGGKAGTGERTIDVKPLRDDLDLRQHDWADANQAHVAGMSVGRIGYMFLPNFNRKGAEDFIRQWQGEVGHQGLIIDVRWNTGGNLSQAVLDIMRRSVVGSFVNREGSLEPLPLLAAPPAMAVIANAQSHSDGDQFPYFFRQYGLGPVIGQRTWGGVQGIKGPWPLIDGTTITIPKDSLASVDGHWIIENEGTPPDVAADPHVNEPLTGRDELLDTAVAVLSKRLMEQPPLPLQKPPLLPAYPAAGQVPGASFGVRNACLSGIPIVRSAKRTACREAEPVR